MAMCKILNSRIQLLYTAFQSQKAVTAYFPSKQLLHFGFVEQLLAQPHTHRQQRSIHELFMSIHYIDEELIDSGIGSDHM